MLIENIGLNSVLYLRSHGFLTGLTFEDFDKESEVGTFIEFLQIKHKCVIAVQDSAAYERYQYLKYSFRCS